jgi:gliding motility-associated lipoprotein GldD
MNHKSTVTVLLVAALTILLVSGCRKANIPRPRGYFRIDMPAKTYTRFDSPCPFVFEYPSYGRVSYATDNTQNPCWFNIDFPDFKAKIHISYRELNKNLAEVLKESEEYAYSHSVKADAITEQPWQNDSSKVYGILYDIKGNAASSVQFFVTDSTSNFLRGALYFSTQPEKDSLAPVIDFFREDIVHLIETFSWKK